ncbi:hypothetical protein [Ekhidna sp.]
MNNQKKYALNKIENTLYMLCLAATLLDMWSSNSHPTIFFLSSMLLVIGVIGIIGIEFTKLRWKQKKIK